ncbi:unnamed protein product [Acanthoscelides obtectus]|uniref:PiggyBac transposable element-derived protein domain-containing protein n=1 Tax=Acanthoscelides obtectus TaxID=200917 RepID=A0A9P0LJR6_ACAOB|nr:unnamed protein product [Acanthoscelides obtectus]CAK1673040.1 Chimeric ERCC6-PGBD3 protein [Acanthoscelides obtectus]
MKKKGRGTIMERVARVDGVDVSVVSWYDNKIVTTVSTYIGSRPISEVQRFCRKERKHTVTPRPKSIEIYNNYMGGVDLLDSMLGYHRILIRSKKFYLRIFFHFLDMLYCNSWILCRRALTENNSDDYLPLAEFKLGLAEILTRSHVTSKKRGRPNSSLQPQLDLKKKEISFCGNISPRNSSLQYGASSWVA